MAQIKKHMFSPTNFNLTQGLRQGLYLWGDTGNEIVRVLPPGTSLDSATVAYALAIETAKGSPLSNTQLLAIDAFIVAEKAAGRWSLHKRLYFPIWANASANAKDMITLDSATLVNSGNMVHASGYVENISDAYYDLGASLSTMGVTATYPSLIMLVRNNNFTVGTATIAMGAYDPGSMEKTIIFSDGAGVNSKNGGPQVSVAGNQHGIFLTSRDSGVAFIKRLKGDNVITTGSDADVTTVPFPTSNIFLGSGNYPSFGGAFYTSKLQIGIGGVSAQLTQAQADAYLRNLKTLWETCTGLTLP